MKTFNVSLLTASLLAGFAFNTIAQMETQAAEEEQPAPAQENADATMPAEREGLFEGAPALQLGEPSTEPEEAQPFERDIDPVVDPLPFDETGVFVAPEMPEQNAIERGATPPAQSQSRNPFIRRESRDSNTSPSAPPRLAFGPGNQPLPPSTGDDEIRLNFRGVPLEMVLNYLSEAAGFIIIPEVDVRGTVDVWSNQPLTRDEAVEVLNSVLSKNGYAALRQGRTLTIVTREEARRRDNPVVAGADPGSIPKTDQIVTQIIPVRYINAAALTTDLQPLLPAQATLTANEAGNALILTDTQSNVRRMVEIVAALDTSVASISSVRVFPLSYADAKELATIIKEVFETPGQNDNQTGRGRMQNFFRGPGGRGGDDATANNTGRAGAARVTAVADERSNSLVVSAPTELIPTIEELVESVDTNIEDITDLRVFHLAHADPVETAELLTSLFQDETQSNNNNNNRNVRFGRGRNNNNNAATEQSDRLRKQTRVVAVADQRTGSVVVSAARTMMPQIEEMVAQLDSDPARKQKVFVYSVENTDPQAVQQVLESLFESPAGRNTRNTRNNNNALGSQLNTRATQQQNQRNTGTTLGGGNFGAGATGR